MESAEEAQLVVRFMERIAPEVVRFTTRGVPGATWYSTEEAASEQRRFLCRAAAQLTVEMSMHLAAAAASISHAAEKTPAPKNAPSTQIEAAYRQQESLGGSP